MPCAVLCSEQAWLLLVDDTERHAEHVWLCGAGELLVRQHRTGDHVHEPVFDAVHRPTGITAAANITVTAAAHLTTTSAAHITFDRVENPHHRRLDGRVRV